MASTEGERYHGRAPHGRQSATRRGGGEGHPAQDANQGRRHGDERGEQRIGHVGLGQRCAGKDTRRDTQGRVHRGAGQGYAGGVYQRPTRARQCRAGAAPLRRDKARGGHPQPRCTLRCHGECRYPHPDHPQAGRRFRIQPALVGVSERLQHRPYRSTELQLPSRQS